MNQSSVFLNNASFSNNNNNNHQQTTTTLLSCTINQIVKLFTPEFGLVVHKQQINLVKIVAKVISLLEENSLHRLFVTDGTTKDGLIIIKWRRANDQLTVSEGCYVKIFGKLKIQNGLLMLIAYSITNITDFNEVSMHCLEVVKESLQLRKIKLKSVCQAEMKSNNNNHHQPMEVDNMETTNQIKTNQTMELNIAGLTTLQRELLIVITNCGQPEGIPKSEIRIKFPSGATEEIDAALDFLTNEAHIYTTIDDEHFKSVLDDE